jgi:hypothetical protein
MVAKIATGEVEDTILPPISIDPRQVVPHDPIRATSPAVTSLGVSFLLATSSATRWAARAISWRGSR